MVCAIMPDFIKPPGTLPQPYLSLFELQSVLNSHVTCTQLETADQCLKLANIQYRSNQLDIAIQNLNLALVNNPKLGDAYSLRAWIHYSKLRQPTQAILDYNKAIAIDPSNGINFVERGFAYALYEYNSQAISDITHGLILCPNDWPGYLRRGLILASCGDYKNAIADYSIALKYVEAYRPPKQKALPYKLRCSARVMDFDFAGALSDFNFAVKLYPASIYEIPIDETLELADNLYRKAKISFHSLNICH